MLLGVLDIGSNSAQLQVFEARPGAPPLPTHAVKEPTLLGEAFGPDDPPGREQIARLRRHVNATLREVSDRLLWEGVPERAIGTSKTFKQLARLSGAPAQRKGPFVRRRVTQKDLEAWIPRLTALHARERAKLRGVSRSRSRQIIAGAVVVRAAMKALNVGSVDVCPWALREGIILHYLQTTLNESFDLPLRPLNGSAYGTDRARFTGQQAHHGDGHVIRLSQSGQVPTAPGG